MKDIYNQPDFGKIVTRGVDGSGDLVEISESYYEDKLHSMEISKTRVLKADGYLDAAEKALKEIHRLMTSKICHDSVTVKFDIDPRSYDISKVHVTHIPRKEQVKSTRI